MQQNQTIQQNAKNFTFLLMKDQHMLHHEEWKAQALPKINTQAPSDFHHITNGKLEREIKSREKKIREENLIMLGKFYKILNRDSMKVQQPYVTSLNRINRKKEHERITTFNMKFSQALQEVKPTYSRDDWQKHIHKTKKLRKQHQSAHFMPQTIRYPGQPFYQIRQRVGSVGSLSKRSQRGKAMVLRPPMMASSDTINEEFAEKEAQSSRVANQTLPISSAKELEGVEKSPSPARQQDNKEVPRESHDETINYQTADEAEGANFPPKKKKIMRKKITKQKLSTGLQMLEPADYKIRNPIIRQMTNELQHLRVKRPQSQKKSSARAKHSVANSFDAGQLKPNK